MKRLVIAALALVAVATPAVVDAWGNTGHRLIGIAAMRALPADSWRANPTAGRARASLTTANATPPISSTWTTPATFSTGAACPWPSCPV
jgi:hypothetical protein